MLELENIVLSYPDGAGRLTALDGVDLQIAAGEFVALTGPSGSGKSSLLAVASTLTTPDSGAVRIGGQLVTGLNSAALAQIRREKLGIIFQAPNLIPALTVAEQLEIAARLNGTPRGNKRELLRKKITELLTEVDMAEHAAKRPGELSGGMRQRVNIARALINDPQVLLVDEPTSALDTERSTAVMQLLKQLTKARGLATAVVTHDTEQLVWCDRKVTLVDGKLS